MQRFRSAPKAPAHSTRLRRPPSPGSWRRTACALHLAWAFCAAGCGERAPRTELVLARCELAGIEAHPVFGIVRGAGDQTFDFGEGWSSPDLQAHELWSVGPRSVLHARLVGRGATLRLECTTAPPLVAAGPLQVAVRLNGQEAGTFQLSAAWEPAVIELPLPDAVLLAGMNRLELLPARQLSAGMIAGEPRPLAVLVRAMEIRASLTSEERRRFEASAAALPAAAEVRPSPRASEGSAEPPAAASADAPDVLVVLMDAARADHLGCYGYTRDTTPRVDALAADGVVLRAVHTPATYTLAAVTSLFTGRSWEQHGVVERGMALADSFSTLAEHLRRAGYWTLGFSPNPFVSKATGLDQGFEEFFESWRAARDSPPPVDAPREPEPTVRAFRDRLARPLPAMPCLVYLHLLPPHEPYAPSAEHDLWTDRDYPGPVDGTSRTLQAMQQGTIPANPDNLRQLGALYDGNLHLADAAVGRAIDAWRSLERARELVVVVLADHGDALGEHGNYGHNLSVHDEVSHVPVVLWPAARWATVQDPAALRSLADVMPMLLGVLRVPFDPAAKWPTEFRNAHATLDPRRTNVLLRGVPSARVHGVRTARWLAVTDGFMLQELFELDSDPGRQRNLRLAHPTQFGTLAATLRARIEQSPLIAQSSAPPVPDAAAEEALRALGYQ